MGALGAIGAILRAAAGLDRQQRRDLDLGRIEEQAMRLLRPEHQLGEGQREQRRDLRAGPVVAQRARGAGRGRGRGKGRGHGPVLLRGLRSKGYFQLINSA